MADIGLIPAAIPHGIGSEMAKLPAIVVVGTNYSSAANLVCLSPHFLRILRAMVEGGIAEEFYRR